MYKRPLLKTLKYYTEPKLMNGSVHSVKVLDKLIFLVLHKQNGAIEPLCHGYYT